MQDPTLQLAAELAGAARHALPKGRAGPPPGAVLVKASDEELTSATLAKVPHTTPRRLLVRERGEGGGVA
jgi:hypothetical protein